MTVEEGHVINIDGSSSHNNTSSMTNNAPSSTAASSSKYKQVPTSGGGERAQSGVGRNALFAGSNSDAEEGNGGGGAANGAADANGTNDKDDRVSVASGASGRSKTTSELEAIAKLPWYRGVTCKDVRDIMPTLLILLGGLLIMIFVIPYAFSSVIKQLEAEELIEQQRREAKIAAYNAKFNITTTTTTQVPEDMEDLLPLEDE